MTRSKRLATCLRVGMLTLQQTVRYLAERTITSFKFPTVYYIAILSCIKRRFAISEDETAKANRQTHKGRIVIVGFVVTVRP